MRKKTNTKITVRHSAEIAALFQHANVRGKKLLEMFPQYSKSAIYRHATKLLGEELPVDGRTKNKGRPAKLSSKDKRHLVRSVLKLRKEEGSFTSPRICEHAGMTGKVSTSTVRRSLNKAGYNYLQLRKKGLLLSTDLKKRLFFCKRVKRLKLDHTFWTEGVSLYLDGKGFQYKTNPLGQARSPAARGWRKKGEGLLLGCTAKGSKEGKVNCNFMVAISYNKGVVLCEQYDGSITGAKMAEIVKSSFPQAFKDSINPKAKRILMDGCPRQNSKIALKAISDVNGKVFSIPPRSPDLNPIENFFNLASKSLRKEALQKKIIYETKEEFCSRVRRNMEGIPIMTVNRIIESMPKRINMILKTGGNRIKY